MRSLGLFAVLLTAVLFCTAALASGHHGHHGGYSHHGHHAGGYSVPGYGYGGPGIRTGFYPNPYGSMSPYQALYMRQLMMQRAMMNNGRVYGGFPRP